MDWHVLLATFGTVFLAEMGDKTQIVALSMAAETGRPWSVLLGASLALIAVSALGVLAGSLLGASLPTVWVKRGAAILFLTLGTLMLAGKL